MIKSRSPSEIRRELDCGGKDKISATVENFVKIMLEDSYYDSLRFNEISGSAEFTDKDGAVRKWTDTDDAGSRSYIETNYGLYSKDKHLDAFRLLCNERKYNPVKQIVEKIEWDRVSRIESFLTKWMKCEDTDYTREVSRLIFAGGINRLYNPGCKFDDVPILIGTRQGEGKSTLIRWLALEDTYYGEVTYTEGQAAIEQLQGKWICEISELLALTKTKEQEAVKAYLTRTVDSYRKPYDRNVTDLPRKVIMIGTSNQRNPLVDKTGNRRWYPVITKSSGYELFDHEEECRDFIRQCWAEAKILYDKGQLPAFANRNLLPQIRQAQDDATQDDWRVGAIEAYLQEKNVGEFVCAKEIKSRVISPDSDREISSIESREIGQILDRMPHWERTGNKTFPVIGKQRAWIKLPETDTQSTLFTDVEEDEYSLPF